MANSQNLIELVFNYAEADCGGVMRPASLKVCITFTHGGSLIGFIDNSELGPIIPVMDNNDTWTLVQLQHIVSIRRAD